MLFEVNYGLLSRHAVVVGIIVGIGGGREEGVGHDVAQERPPFAIIGPVISSNGSQSGLFRVSQPSIIAGFKSLAPT